MPESITAVSLVADNVALGEVLDGNDRGAHSEIEKTESSQFKIRNRGSREQKFISSSSSDP
jgi:hypothetical protein